MRTAATARPRRRHPSGDRGSPSRMGLDRNAKFRGSEGLGNP